MSLKERVIIERNIQIYTSTNTKRWLAGMQALFIYTPQKLSNWSMALRGIDLLASNVEALNTRAFNSEGVQIFYQEVQYNRFGPILEIGINYAFNSSGKTKQKSKKTFGEEQF
jgi:hypothetical protein